jgi:hypothetical protein
MASFDSVCSVFCFLNRSHFAEAPQVSLGRAESRREKRINQVPCDSWADGSAAYTEDIHVIVLDALPGREVVVDQRCADSAHLVCAYRSAHATAADRHSTLHLRCCEGASQRKNIVRIVIALIEGVCAEIDNLMSCSPKPRDQLFFQAETTVIRCNSNAHTNSSLPNGLPVAVEARLHDSKSAVLAQVLDASSIV